MQLTTTRTVLSAAALIFLASGLGRVSLRGSWYQQTHMEITDINVANAVRVGEGQIPGYDTFDASPHALRPLF